MGSLYQGLLSIVTPQGIVTECSEVDAEDFKRLGQLLQEASRYRKTPRDLAERIAVLTARMCESSQEQAQGILDRIVFGDYECEPEDESWRNN